MSIIKRRMELKEEFGQLQAFGAGHGEPLLARQFLRLLPIICSPNHSRHTIVPVATLLLFSRDVLRQVVRANYSQLKIKNHSKELMWEAELSVSAPEVLLSFAFSDNDKEIGNSSVFLTPLFPELGKSARRESFERLTRNYQLMMDGIPSGEFWSEWYRGFLDGKPLDWELQCRVAQLSDTIWNAGPDAVAAAIEHIRSRRSVETTHAELNESLNAQTSARHGIGGNNPPESIQDERLSGAITLIWEAEEELSEALEQENPARGWIEAILVKFKAGLTSLLKWCAGKVNLAVGTAIVVGTTKGSTVVVDTYIAKHPEKIEALIEALERWLPFLS